MDCEPDSGDEDGCGCKDRFGKGSLCALFSLFSMLISYNQNVLEINRPPQPVYQNVIEQTHQLAVRTLALGVRSGQQGAPSAETDQQTAQAVAVN